MASHAERASAERVVSGGGLKRIHAFLREQRPHLEPPDISARALEDRASLSAQALAIFIRCYGSFAGDMALAFLARGGALAATIPVRLETNESLGLAGAALAAMEEIPD